VVYFANPSQSRSGQSTTGSQHAASVGGFGLTRMTPRIASSLFGASISGSLCLYRHQYWCISKSSACWNGRDQQKHGPLLGEYITSDGAHVALNQSRIEPVIADGAKIALSVCEWKAERRYYWMQQEIIAAQHFRLARFAAPTSSVLRWDYQIRISN
jgi:hypothetical protein